LIRSGRAEFLRVNTRVYGYEGEYPKSGGKWGVPRVVGLVTDHYDSASSRGTRIVGQDCVVHELRPGHAIEVSDIDVRFGSQQITGRGSRADGSFLLWSPNAESQAWQSSS
jgi:hypothetical protein